MKIFFNKKITDGFTRIVNFGIVFKNNLKKPKTFLMPKSTTGFTLIELLVVISIISMLSSIVLSSLNDARQKAKDTAASESVRQVENALELYFSDVGGYPLTKDELITKGLISYISPELNYLPIMEDGIKVCDSSPCPKYSLFGGAWQDPDPQSGYDLVGAYHYCLYKGDGWRLPSDTELVSAYNSSIKDTFQPVNYWANTDWRNWQTGKKWHVDMYDGSRSSSDNYYIYNVRCIK